MLNDPVLLNDWHVVAFAPDLKEGSPMAVRLLEEDIVLWRVGDKNSRVARSLPAQGHKTFPGQSGR